MKVTLVSSAGTDLLVVNAARVSFNKEKEIFDHDDMKLLEYLAKHNHTSPFNHIWLSFHVKAPIFVARQLVKHKFLPWNEVSRRYVDTPPEFYTPPTWRCKAKDKKQGSGGEVKDQAIVDKTVKDINELTRHTYNSLLEYGVAPEQARMILPHNTYTEWRWSGSGGAWLDMLAERIEPDTQWETRQVALDILEVMRDLYPGVMNAFKYWRKS